ncbi:MAG: DUF547 domain-containing protein [Verrucomicrobia bacterium]|nr:DUF547 domain-containing protein [Verrucomicrobiota bacterium]
MKSSMCRRTLMAAGCFIASILAAAPTVTVPAGIDPQPWDALLTKYVDERGLVAYEKWKNDPAELAALDAFIAQYAATPARPAQGAEEIAALINAYNAFTIRWILRHYPAESVRALDASFSGARWNVGGRTVSLDDIEHRNLRPVYGWKGAKTSGFTFYLLQPTKQPVGV